MPRQTSYNKEFKKYREQICKFKEEGLTPMAIQLYYRAQGIELNYKSIQSVKEPYMNSPYRLFKIQAVSYLIDYLQQLTNLSRMIEDYIAKTDRQLWKLITQKIHQLCGLESHLRNLIPSNREEKEMRRIKSEIRQKVIEKIIDLRTTQAQEEKIVHESSEDEVDFEENIQNQQEQEDQDFGFGQDDQPFQGMDNPTQFSYHFFDPEKNDSGQQYSYQLFPLNHF